MKRVVVTGMGAITPIGNDVPSFWEGLSHGTNGIDVITAFDVSDFKYKLAAQIKQYDPLVYLDKITVRKLSLIHI